MAQATAESVRLSSNGLHNPMCSWGAATHIRRKPELEPLVRLAMISYSDSRFLWLDYVGRHVGDTTCGYVEMWGLKLGSWHEM